MLKKSLFTMAGAVALGMSFAGSAEAATIGWDLTPTEIFEGTLSGMIFADETATIDGIINPDEITSWMFDYTGGTGTSPKPAFEISADRGGSNCTPSGSGHFVVQADDSLKMSPRIGGLGIPEICFGEGFALPGTDVTVRFSNQGGITNFFGGIRYSGNINGSFGSVEVLSFVPKAVAVPEPSNFLSLLALGAVATGTVLKKK